MLHQRFRRELFRNGGDGGAGKTGGRIANEHMYGGEDEIRMEEAERIEQKRQTGAGVVLSLMASKCISFLDVHKERSSPPATFPSRPCDTDCLRTITHEE